MKSQAPEKAFVRTADVNTAAALSVLGIPIEVDQTKDIRLGKGWTTFLLGLESVPFKSLGIQQLASDPLPSHNTKTILGLISNGALQKADPGHPALDVLRACKARETLMQMARTGDRYRLVKVQGAPRYLLTPGEESQSVKDAKLLFRTRDLKLAACLTVCGCPVAKIEGNGGDHVFLLLAAGYGSPPPMAADLAQAWRTGRLAEISPEHPLLWMMQGLSNRDAILDFVKRQKKTVLIRAPSTGRASLVPEGASGKTMQRVHRHLGI